MPRALYAGAGKTRRTGIPRETFRSTRAAFARESSVAGAGDRHQPRRRANGRRTVAPKYFSGARHRGEFFVPGAFGSNSIADLAHLAPKRSRNHPACGSAFAFENAQPLADDARRRLGLARVKPILPPK